MIVSGGLQRDSAIYIHVSILPQTCLPSRLPHNIEQSSLCCRTLLVIHFKYTSVYMLVPNSLTIPNCYPSPLETISSFSEAVIQTTCFLSFFVVVFYFFVIVVFWPFGMQYLSSLTGDRTCIPCIGITESQALDCQGSPDADHFQQMEKVRPSPGS